MNTNFPILNPKNKLAPDIALGFSFEKFGILTWTEDSTVFDQIDRQSNEKPDDFHVEL